MLLYYITDRVQFAGNENERTAHLLERIAEAAIAGVDFIQLRENDLSTRDLEALAHAALEKIRASKGKTRLLINSRSDVALAVGSDGVHLRSHDISPQDVRSIWNAAKGKTHPTISVSCHVESDVVSAKANGADLAIFAPVFEKKNAPAITPTGLDLLRSACRYNIPVLALGGVTAQNAHSCIAAGAAGVAGIRLFQKGDLAGTVKDLRGSSATRNPHATT